MDDEGGRGVREMLTMAEKGGGGRGLDPLFLADIFCEHPLTEHRANCYICFVKLREYHSSYREQMDFCIPCT